MSKQGHETANMTARDELAVIIDAADDAWDKVVATTVEWAQDIADAVLAAGYRVEPGASVCEDPDAAGPASFRPYSVPSDRGYRTPAIPESANRAAEAAYTEKLAELRLSEGGGFKVASQVKRSLRAALEAAAPHIERALTDRLLEAGWQEPPKPYVA